MSQSFEDLVRSTSQTEMAKLTETALSRLQYRVELWSIWLLVSAISFAAIWAAVFLLHRFAIAGPKDIWALLCGFLAIFLWLKVIVRSTFSIGRRAVVREAARSERGAVA
jgi:uncharacterized BrkB/YihY/UPF0761 family membrane protein